MIDERKLLYLIIAIAVLVACFTIMVGVIFAAAAVVAAIGSTMIMMAEGAIFDRPLIMHSMGLTGSIS